MIPASGAPNCPSGGQSIDEAFWSRALIEWISGTFKLFLKSDWEVVVRRHTEAFRPFANGNEFGRRNGC
jgi:hypothetical protein